MVKIILIENYSHVTHVRVPFFFSTCEVDFKIQFHCLWISIVYNARNKESKTHKSQSMHYLFFAFNIFVFYGMKTINCNLLQANSNSITQLTALEFILVVC